MKILVLWSKPSGYLLSQLKSLHELGLEVHLIAQSNENEAPFIFHKDYSFLKTFILIDQVRSKLLAGMVSDINPDVIFICSWNNRSYLRIARQFRVTRILFMDNQWRNSLRQIAGVCLRRIIIFPHFDGVLLPGERQEKFAKFLGFHSSQIARNGYSADVERFDSANPSPHNRNFLYVGRLIKAKGLDILLNGYISYRKTVENPWEIRLVGNGDLKKYILETNIPGVTVVDFVQPAFLSSEYAAASCFILPSRFEPWGLVLHEAAASGLPIISSDACGSSDEFVENGLNGYIFTSENDSELTDLMIKIHNKSELEWYTMSKASRTMALKITPKIWANSLLNLATDLQERSVSK